MLLIPKQLVVFFTGALAAVGLVSGQPTATIAPSPHSMVLLTWVPIPSSSDPVLSAIFAGNRSVLIPLSFYLTNQSTEPVVGLNVVWVATSKSGKLSTFRSSSDSFSSPKAHLPIINPGERILVIPGGSWPPDSGLRAYAQGGHFDNLQFKADAYSNAAQVAVRIDTIILGNGVVAGPDSFRFVDDLTARKQAAEAVVAALDNAKAKEIAPGEALASMLNPGIFSVSDYATAWKQRFARSALQIPAFADHYLRQLPTLPELGKASTPPN